MKAAARIVLAVAAVTFGVLIAAPYWTASSLIVRVAGTSGWIGAAARWNTPAVEETIERVPIRDGATRARVYRPAGTSRRAVLLVSGVHRDGIDEPRLIYLARELAATGIVVATPEIADLINYRLTARATDTIEDTAGWMLSRRDLFGRGDVGIIGVSFSGGLSIVAAGRPAVRDRIAFVLSFGGHGNLPRVLRYLCTGEGAPRPPHDYAAAVLLHQAAELIVPAAQVAPLEQAVEQFLEASALNRTNRAEAERRFETARRLQSETDEPSATLLRYMNDRDVASLGARLLPHIAHFGHDPALSPDRSPAPAAPVFLLHGADDNVIPAVESERLAAHVAGKTRVRLLVTGFLTHVDVTERPSIRDTWSLIAFWKAVMAS